MNDQNLKPFTVSQARENGAKGGKASAKAKKERAIISSLYAKTLSKKIKLKIDGVETALLGEEVLARRIQKIYVNGSDRNVIALAKEMREALEGSKVSITNNDGGPFGIYLLSREEAQARLDELRAKQNAQ